MGKKKYFVVCPKCGSSNTRAKGYLRGIHRILCKDCGRTFYNPNSDAPTRTVTKVKSVTLPKPTQNVNVDSVEKEVSLNLDSVADIPCFWCLENDKNCIIYCEDLKSFLREL